MRYSRFRASLLGIEPQRRNRTGPNKSKVTKSKKEVKPKKEKEEKVGEDQHIKPDPSAAPESRQEPPKVLSPKVKDEVIKQEPQQPHSEALFTTVEMPPVSIPETQMQLHHSRLLTPCSDTDLLSAPRGYAASPVNETIHTHRTSPYDYTGAAHCRVAPDQVASPWQPSPSYPPFQIQTYEVDGYCVTPSAFCDHQHAVTHPEGFGIAPGAMMPLEHGRVPVKNEDWNNHFC